MLGSACDRQVGSGSDIDRQQVVADRRSLPEEHLLPREIETNGLIEHRIRARKARERFEVDVRFFFCVVAGNESGQHARVRRLHHARDKGHAGSRKRRHPELLEDDHVTVAAAEEDESLSKWKGQSILRASPTRFVTRSRSRYSSSGIAYLRVML